MLCFGVMFESINPYTGQVIGEYAELSEAETEEKLISAQNAFKTWRKTSFEERAILFKNLAKILKDEKQQYAEMITLEMGKPLQSAKDEIDKCALVCEYYADHAQDFLTQEDVDTHAAESFVTYEPLGAVLAIMPWNYPFWQVYRFAAPALMAGNVGVLKHAPNVLGCASLVEQTFVKAGFPKDVFQNFIVHHDKIDKIIKHPVIKAVTLTGSERAGSAVAAQAGSAIKKTVLELGGSNAFIVLNDADLEKAVEVGVLSRMQNAGQSCIAAKRFFLHEDIAERYLHMFREKIKQLESGNPLEEGVQIGPMARVDLAEELAGQIQRSLEAGARLFHGGKRDETYFEPTMLTNVQPGMPAFEEELFGPVAAFTIVSSAAEAVELSNRSELGLGATIFTQNIAEAKKLIPEFEDGSVFINAMVKSDPRLPFGGTKKSGFGRELGSFGIKEFTNIKTVFIA